MIRFQRISSIASRTMNCERSGSVCSKERGRPGPPDPGRRWQPCFDFWTHAAELYSRRRKTGREHCSALQIRDAVNTDTNRAEGPRGKALPARPTPSTNETTAPILQEIILTRIVDPENNHLLGALLLGFPLPELVPQPKSETATNAIEFEPIQTAILLGDRIYANTNVISESLAAALAGQLGHRMGQAQKERDEFDSVIEGIHYRVFYELLNGSSAL